MRRATDITLIVDRSGSMTSCKDAMEESLNAYVEDQKKLSDPCVLSLITFDDYVKTEFTAMPLADVKKIVITPRGSTALLDAMAQAIDDTGARLAAMPEYMRPDKVMIIVITDGEENSSRVFTKQQVFDRIRCQREQYQWTFLFLGAGQDAIASATSVGISAGNTLNFTTAGGGVQARGTNYVSKALNVATANVRSGSEAKTSGGILLPMEAGGQQAADTAYEAVFGDKGASNKIPVTKSK